MTETEPERPARPPMNIGQLIVDRAKPVIREGGYAYEFATSMTDPGG
jgi:hypothetical protein